MSKPLFSLGHFLDFVRSRDPNEKYDYLDNNACACKQYCDSVGIQYNIFSEKCGGYCTSEGHRFTSNAGLERLAHTAPRNKAGYQTFGTLASHVKRAIDEEWAFSHCSIIGVTWHKNHVPMV